MPRGLKLTGQNYSMGYDMLVRKNTLGSSTIWVDWQWGVRGASSVSIGSITGAKTGTAPVVGSLNKSIGDISCGASFQGDAFQLVSGFQITEITGAVLSKGALSQSIGNITIVSAGGIPPAYGELSQSIGIVLTATGVGVVIPLTVGELSKSVGNITLILEGGFTPTGILQISDEVKTWLMVEDSTITSIDIDEEVKAIAMTNAYTVDLEVYDAIR